MSLIKKILLIILTPLLRLEDYIREKIKYESISGYDITRFEVIDTEGRQIVYYGKVVPSYQDEGRTLKVFLDKPLNRKA